MKMEIEKILLAVIISIIFITKVVLAILYWMKSLKVASCEVQPASPAAEILTSSKDAVEINTTIINNNYCKNGKSKQTYDETKIIPKPVGRNVFVQPGPHEIPDHYENIPLQNTKVLNPNRIFLSFKKKNSKESDPEENFHTRAMKNPYDAMKFQKVDYSNKEVFKRRL